MTRAADRLSRVRSLGELLYSRPHNGIVIVTNDVLPVNHNTVCSGGIVRSQRYNDVDAITFQHVAVIAFQNMFAFELSIVRCHIRFSQQEGNSNVETPISIYLRSSRSVVSMLPRSKTDVFLGWISLVRSILSRFQTRRANQ